MLCTNISRDVTDVILQVCSHIVQGIKKETVRVRDEWETCLLLKQDPFENR